MRTLLTVMFSTTLASCVDPLTAKSVNTPEWDVKNIERYGETVAGLPPETTFGWDLVVTGDLARWRECTALDACGNVERSRLAADLKAVERVGQATIDGRRVDVLKLSLAARPRYVVPYKNPAAR